MSETNGKENGKSGKKPLPEVLKPHLFQPGNQAGVGHGRPPTSKLWQAIQKVEKDKRQPFLEHVARQAYKDNRLIPPILDRIEPKLQSDDAQPAHIVVNVLNFTVEAPAAA